MRSVMQGLCLGACAVLTAGQATLPCALEPFDQAMIAGMPLQSAHTSRIVVDGDYAYILADGPDLTVVDVSDPERPVEMGTLWATGTAHDIVLRDGYAFLAGGTTGLVVCDVRDPGSMGVLTVLDFDADIQTLEIRSHIIWAGGPDGLYTINVGDPAAPFVADSHDLDLLFGLEMTARGLFATTGAGLRVLDHTRPWSIREIASYADLSGSLASDGDTLFVTSSHGDGGLLRVFDISDPTSLGMTGSVVLPEPHVGPPLPAGDTLYLAGRGIAKIDVSDPHSPALEGYIYTDLLYGSRPTAYASGALLVAGNGYLREMRVFDASGPLQDTPVLARVPMPPSAQPKELAKDGSLVYVLSRPLNVVPHLLVIDGSRPDDPEVEYLFNVAPGSDRLAVEQGIAYMASYAIDGCSGGNPQGRSLSTYDLGAPTPGSLLGEFDLGGADCHEPVGDVRVRDGYAYVANMSRGVWVVDVSDPAQPALADDSLLLHAARGLAIGNDLMCVAGELFTVCSLRDPARPAIVGQLAIPGGGLERVILGGHLAFVSQTSGRLNVIDISDPTAPALLGTHAFPSALSLIDSMAVRGDLLLLEGGSLCQVLDISDPGNPRPRRNLTLDHAYSPLCFMGDCLYSTGGGHVTVIDMSPDCDACAPDLNGDGSLNFFDVAAFLAAYNAQDPIADFTGDGLFNFFDMAAFLTTYSAGCP